MATQADVRRIALSFPGTEEAKDRFAFSVLNKGKLKGFAWVWMERIDPKRPRVPNPGVIAVRVANLGQRDAILSSDSKKFFTEPHYAGFPAVLVRLDPVTTADVKTLIAEAWRCQAPPELTNETKSGRPKKAASLAKGTKRTKRTKRTNRTNRTNRTKRTKRAKKTTPSPRKRESRSL